MVLATKVGKQRPFWRGFLLNVVTFGLYGLYWNYKAHDEVFEQFELKREGRDEGVVWYILGLVFLPVLFVYYYMFVANVQYVRQRLDLKGGISAGGFIGILIGGMIVYIAALVPFFIALANVPEDATRAELTAAMLTGFLWLGLGLLAMLALYAVAYYRLQNDINGVWDAYDARITQLRASGPAAPPPAQPAAQEWSYGADLSPPPGDQQRRW